MIDALKESSSNYTFASFSFVDSKTVWTLEVL